jgi:hypothetical protein
MPVGNASTRCFAGLELVNDMAPDETTILKFRHFPEQHGLTARMTNLIDDLPENRGLPLEGGMMADTTIIPCAFFDEKSGEVARSVDLVARRGVTRE